ncbi:DUF3253 domain-containing protein [Sedimentitalea todarodis]|uniref:DUF3253 domain-containing protein n=1 Tax=Sedimentitalea todarodis TaxID=1631240 RepID=A0ABU3VKS6_9RHOB|nr:DUF3253 domain-containing protein [Sedimentitalea todarodis]MDU9006792.1 DUF3253 domain-containing protein [Sedimentitalea todarodis]
MSAQQIQNRDAILRLAATRGSGKTICPSEIARAVGGADPKVWRPLMAPKRDEAILLAKAGSIKIEKPGEAVDPNDFAGVYRIEIVGGQNHLNLSIIR